MAWSPDFNFETDFSFDAVNGMGTILPFPKGGTSPRSANSSIPLADGAPTGDVFATETRTATTVGTETTRETETTQSRVNSDLLSRWLIRIVVVLLGFIFVAVGLSMFKSGQTIAVKVKEAVAR